MSLRERLKRASALLMLISILPNQILAQENPGRFSRVTQGAPSPFDAWCFDDKATAFLYTKIEYADDRCQLKINKALEEESARHSLALGNLQIRFETLEEQSKNISAIKDEEIQRLERAALKRPNDHTMWWAAGGFAIGVTTTVLIFITIK